MIGISKKNEGMLYYFYMMSDGEITHNEEKLFEKICVELGITESEKQEIISSCNDILDFNRASIENVLCGKSKSKKVMEIAEGFLSAFNGSSGSFYSSFETYEHESEDKLTRIIWNMINLGYADEHFTDEEKRIVKHFVKKWNIKEEIYFELIDIADTMLALEKQREWLLSTYSKGKKRNEKEKKIDKATNELLSDVKITIKELSM